MPNYTEYGRYGSAEGEHTENGGVGHPDHSKNDRCQPDAYEDLPSTTKARWNLWRHCIKQGDLELRVEQVGVHLVC
jgi:hypothetical protein